MLLNKCKHKLMILNKRTFKIMQLVEDFLSPIYCAVYFQVILSDIQHFKYLKSMQWY